MSLYGTRDAAKNFQDEVCRFMTGIGFQQSRYNPQVYWHHGRDIKALVHGDDFMSTAYEKDARWFRKQLEQRFEAKSVILGVGPDKVAEDRILGRIIRATENGWEYEADPRHAEVIIQELGLQEAKGVASPGDGKGEMNELNNNEGGIPLSPGDARLFRSLAARAMYLSQGWADIAFVARSFAAA